MENWGLITFRETRLLVDDQKTSTGNKQNVALVIAHELAHQWFGNLVSLTKCCNSNTWSAIAMNP